SSFFFQAEDGIRDFHVTGVQTCALRIFRPATHRRPGGQQAAPLLLAPVGGEGGRIGEGDDRLPPVVYRRDARRSPVPPAAFSARSEERRVGKECRSRWCAYDARDEARVI